MGKKDQRSWPRSDTIRRRAKRLQIGKDTANQIFDMMEKFAGYGFNKSHAACYSLVAYQTAFLKRYYPAEFMAASISTELNDTKRVIVFLEECRRMGLSVRPPSINQGYAEFVVRENAIEFCLAAVKNVGRGAIEAIVAERDRNGPYKDLFDLCSPIDLRAVNRKVIESLIEAGAMDDLPAAGRKNLIRSKSRSTLVRKRKTKSQRPIFNF
jgi:DNA polymerase-3 subunit alpha